MTETSPSQRATRDEDLACTSFCSSLRAEHDREGAGQVEKHGCEGEGWNLFTRDRHDFLEVDAPAHRLGSPADRNLENSDMNESSPCGRLDALGNLDEARPVDRFPMNATSPEVSNEDIGVSAELLYVNGETDKKRKLCTASGSPSNGHGEVLAVVKKAKKRPVNVWAKTSSRRGFKKHSKNVSLSNSKSNSVNKEDYVCITLAGKHQIKTEDGPGLPVVLSEFHKTEKIVLSDDKLSASNTKGYRMVRGTRGVVEGAWFFEILVKSLGPSGHTRLGWSTQKGEIQAPVGFDNYSYAYRDVDGSKVHKAVREQYGQPYREGDVLGFYINLPNGAELAPKPASIVSYKGQPYILEEKEEPLKVLPGSEIVFFRNGVFQGTAFKDINAGRYFPAASMYTLPNDPDCVVTFHFGPDFIFPPKDIGERPMPHPMSCAPYCGMDSLGFGSIARKIETPGLDATYTPELQRTGEARSIP
ncbi:hypothetical protein L7F22_001590 [Adiantum nelumboides]|nr:hypothetical protein [Adiantum nelumboides]